MRIAIISDIHSNMQAMEMALQVIDQCRVDQVFCLGDIVGYGANPNECVELVRSRCTQIVRGNHDLAAVDLSHAKHLPPHGQIAAKWTFAQLSDENRRFLAWLPFRRVIDDCTLVHANPGNVLSWAYVNSLEIAVCQFPHFTTPLCLIGHTHVPSVCGENLHGSTLVKGMKFLINVGSVGQPRDGNPQLSFGLLDTNEWTYENIRTEYDVDGAAEAIVAAGLPRSLALRLSQGT